jgi:hypothetical protein
MPRAFEITSPAKTFTLDAASKGQMTFAVTNQLDHAVKVRATIVPDGATKGDWLSLAEAIKDVNIKQTETFTVKVAVPPGTPVGDYAFKIVAASEASPEEESTEGPQVMFHLGKPTTKPKIPWLLIIILGAVFVVGLGVALFFILRHKGGDTKPEVVHNIGDHCKDDSGCDAEQRCGELPSGSKVCLLRPGKECTNDLECSSLWCMEKKDAKSVCSRDDGSCSTVADCRGDMYECLTNMCLKKIDEPCSEGNECTTGNCENKKCRPAAVPCAPPCDDDKGQVCIGGKCVARYRPPKSEIIRSYTNKELPRAVKTIQPNR